MFKRIEKRIRKKEKEEELGLDEDTKEMLGMNDTDSDESDSSSDSDSDGGSEDEGLHAMGGAQLGGSDEEDGEEGGEEEGSEPASDEEDEDEDEEPPMSVSEALQNPLYLVSLEPEVKACVVCPGKLLKNPTMIDVHLKSGVSSSSSSSLRAR